MECAWLATALEFAGQMEKVCIYGNMPNPQYLLILYPVAAILYAVFACGPRTHRQDKRELKARLTSFLKLITN